MTNPKISYDPPYLDEEERELMESFHDAIDRGEITPDSKKELEIIQDKWSAILAESEKRKAITLRLQTRDITRLKTIARRRGIPYQTLVTSVLHQFANGDIVERP